MKEIELEFTKIVGEGKALGRRKGKVVFCYGVIPGEKAKVRIKKEKRNFIEAELVDIIEKSPYRIKPLEEHYLTCSPWQTIDYTKQVEYKKKLIEENFYQSVKENIKIDRFYSAENIFAYRTKIEYSFADINGKLFLAFHKRGDYSVLIPLEHGCKLINEKTNRIALDIVSILNAEGIKTNQLKTLILRRSVNTDEVIASLFVKDEKLDYLDFSSVEGLKGYNIVYSNPVASTSTVDRILKSSDNVYIEEIVCGMKIRYGFDCFFQNNIELFEKAIEEIKDFISAKVKRITDLYAGVGVIGFVLKDMADEIISVEAVSSSSFWAEENAKLNKIENVKIINSIAEKINLENYLESDVLIVDPPRAGLHKNVIKSIMKKLPSKIAYLSCNSITQGRDLNFLLEKYRIVKTTGFDFYPNTPHIETLVMLERK